MIRKKAEAGAIFIFLSAWIFGVNGLYILSDNGLVYRYNILFSFEKSFLTRITTKLKQQQFGL